jgi:DNA/RNA endonuclease YhcR with UshA esterase domain
LHGSTGTPDSSGRTFNQVRPLPHECGVPVAVFRYASGGRSFLFFVAEAGQNASTVCMRTFLSILVVLTFAIKLSAADTNSPMLPKTSTSTLLKIGTGEADKHYGQEMIVTGKVAQVTIRPKVTFLNLDRAFPNSPFTVAIFHGHSSFYGDANALKGKSIEIRGKIKNYNDKPEISLDDANQLTVLGSTVSTNIPAVTQPINASPPSTESTNFPDIM